MNNAWLMRVRLLSGYTALMLLCLRQWRSAEPWAHLDRFSGGYCLLAVLWFVTSSTFFGLDEHSPETMKEASGASFDPTMLKGIAVISVAELLVLIDYADLHLLPGLKVLWLQYSGLILSFIGVTWLAWVDRYLVTYFKNDSRMGLLDKGPYRFVRHPRYLALAISRFSFALIFASPIAWAFVILWVMLIIRRIRLEEAHMRERFAEEYTAYSSHTARLLPGIY